MLDLVEARGNRAGADAFQQRRHRRGVAEPRAVIDVVGAEARAHELLEEIGFLVRPLGGAETGERAGSVPVPNLPQTRRRNVERLVPAGFAKLGEGVSRVDVDIGRFRRVFPADQRRRQPVPVIHVVEAEAALDAEPAVVGRAVLAVDPEDLVVLDVEGELAADAAVGADAVDLLGGLLLADLLGGHQRAGGAGLDAFAAGDAGALAHRIVEVEDDLVARAPAGHADHVVDLYFAAGADAARAMDAGVQVDGHRRVSEVGSRGLPRFEAARREPHGSRPVPELARRVVAGFGRRLIGEQQLHHHVAGAHRALRIDANHHPVRRLADAGGRKNALAFDLHHADPAVAVRPVAGLRRVAEVGNVDPVPLGDLPDCLVRLCGDRPAVEGEADHVAHASSSGK